MPQISRRSLLAGGGGLSTLALLAACGGSSGSGAGPGATASLRWWDHFSALQKFHKEWAKTQSQALGVAIEYTYNDVSRSTEALQLANQSKQLPDIYSNVVGLPLPALVAEGWVHEIALPEEAKAALPEGAYTEGITTIDGKLYGLPLFSYQQYAAAQWFNVDIVSDAGLDPDSPPASYDEYRANLEKIKASGSDAAPMVLALGGVARMREQMDDLAQAAGFPGSRARSTRRGSSRTTTTRTSTPSSSGRSSTTPGSSSPAAAASPWPTPAPAGRPASPGTSRTVRGARAARRTSCPPSSRRWASVRSSRPTARRRRRTAGRRRRSSSSPGTRRTPSRRPRSSPR